MKVRRCFCDGCANQFLDSFMSQYFHRILLLRSVATKFPALHLQMESARSRTRGSASLALFPRLRSPCQSRSGSEIIPGGNGRLVRPSCQFQLLSSIRKGNARQNFRGCTLTEKGFLRPNFLSRIFWENPIWPPTPLRFKDSQSDSSNGFF
jgi:hypothetical protein